LVQLLELELELAVDAPTVGDRALELGIERGRELARLQLRCNWIAAPRKNEQAIRVSVDHIESATLQPALRPEQHLAAHTGQRVPNGGIRKTTGRRAEHAVERVHENLDRL